MRVREFQTLIQDLYLEKDRARGTEGTFLWLAEEVGELSRSLRKRDFFNAQEEIADVIAWTMSIANLLGIDVEQALREKYPGHCANCGKIPCACP